MYAFSHQFPSARETDSFAEGTEGSNPPSSTGESVPEFLSHLPAPLEHFIAYAGVAAIAMAGYGSGRVNVRIIGGLCVYAGILEYTRDFSPGRHPAIGRFVGSALGTLCGGLAIVLLSRRASDQPR